MDNKNYNLGDVTHTHKQATMLLNSKYTEIWKKLKEHKKVEVTVLDPTNKTKIIRGISQLKNVDLEWKNLCAANYYLRLKPTVLGKTREGYLVLQLELVDSVKYRNGRI